DAEILSRQNDEFRQGIQLIPIGTIDIARRTTKLKGEIVTTIGVHTMTSKSRKKLFQEVINYNDFTSDNDPCGEHDFGSIDIEGETYFWKIDYYDSDVRYGSSEPTNPDKTYRVLTVMRSDEY
ncbi:MAG: DUF3768 domain-containing protein, partial [Cyclobacteriaceae bacterium]